MGRVGATHRHRPTGRQDESQSGNLEVGTPGTRRAENSQLGPESPYLWGLAGACVSVSVCARACAAVGARGVPVPKGGLRCQVCSGVAFLTVLRFADSCLTWVARASSLCCRIPQGAP